MTCVREYRSSRLPRRTGAAATPAASASPSDGARYDARMKPLCTSRRVRCLAVLLTFAAGLPASLADGGLFGWGKKDKDADLEDVFAIKCLVTSDAERKRIIDAYADALKKVRGLSSRKVLALHGEEESTLYYGDFRRVFNSATGENSYEPDPRPALETIRSLYIRNSRLPENAVENWPFRFATIAQLPHAGSGHPEWNLDNAAGYWSLQVAVFYNVDEMRQRRRAAVEYCQLLREQGVEAYYHHGDQNSEVCVGLFPPEAVQQVTEKDAYTGSLKIGFKIADPRLMELQKQHPHCLENGFKVFRSRSSSSTAAREPNPSFIVKCPKDTTRANLQARGQSGE